jgi:hypothetical protein
MLDGLISDAARNCRRFFWRRAVAEGRRVVGIAIQEGEERRQDDGLPAETFSVELNTGNYLPRTTDHREVDSRMVVAAQKAVRLLIMLAH